MQLVAFRCVSSVKYSNETSACETFKSREPRRPSRKLRSGVTSHLLAFIPSLQLQHRTRLSTTQECSAVSPHRDLNRSNFILATSIEGSPSTPSSRPDTTHEENDTSCTEAHQVQPARQNCSPTPCTAESCIINQLWDREARMAERRK